MGRKNKKTQNPTPKAPAQLASIPVVPAPVAMAQFETVQLVQLVQPKYQECDRLGKENDDLRNQLAEMTGRKNMLEELNSKNEKTINELKKENKELKERIRILEEENSKHNQRVSELENNFRIEKLTKNIIVAIQDVNRVHSLEQTIDTNYVDNLIDLRDNRNTLSHYIRYNRKPNDDKFNIIKYKMQMLLKILNDKETSDIVADIEYNYDDGFFDAIKMELQKTLNLSEYQNLQEPSEREKQVINKFWN